MNYAADIELTSDIVGRKMTHTANYSEQVNPSAHCPYTYKALDDAWVRRGGLTIRIYAINPQYEISPVNAH